MQRTPEQEASPLPRPPNPDLVRNMENFGLSAVRGREFREIRRVDVIKAAVEYFGLYPSALWKFVLEYNVLDLPLASSGRKEHVVDSLEKLECFGGLVYILKRWIGDSYGAPKLEVLKAVTEVTRTGLGSDPRALLIHEPSEKKSKKEEPEENGESLEEFSGGVVVDLSDHRAKRGPREKQFEEGPVQSELVHALETEKDPRKLKYLKKCPILGREDLDDLSKYTLDGLRTFKEKLPDSIDEVAFIDAQPPIEGVRLGKNVVKTRFAQAVMFISHFRTVELPLFDPSLERLTYKELRIGVDCCIAYLEEHPKITDLSHLFQVVQKTFVRNITE